MAVSPFSIASCLAMLMQGTKDEAQEQIANALGLEVKKREDVASLIKKMTTTFQSTKNVELLIASKMYVKKGAKVKKEFSDFIQRKFGAAPEVIDFKRSKTREIINTWCEENTNGKIRNFFEHVESDSDIVLVNAIYFKTPWQYQFPPIDNAKMPFYVSEKVTIQQEFMVISNYFLSGKNKDLDCRVIELLFRDKHVSMMVLLPNKIEGLAALEKKLKDDEIDVRKLIVGCGFGEDKFKKEAVELKLPKFKITCECNLKTILPEVVIHFF